MKTNTETVARHGQMRSGAHRQALDEVNPAIGAPPTSRQRPLAHRPNPASAETTHEREELQ